MEYRQYINSQPFSSYSELRQLSRQWEREKQISEHQVQITGGRSERIASLTETSESAPKKKSRKNKQAESIDGEVAELIEQKAGKQGQPQGGNPRARPQQLCPQAQVFQWQGQQKLYQTNEEQKS